MISVDETFTCHYVIYMMIDTFSKIVLNEESRVLALLEVRLKMTRITSLPLRLKSIIVAWV